MEKRVFIIEHHDDKNKRFDGFNPDTKQILDDINNQKNIKGEVVFFVENKKDILQKYIQKFSSLAISRIELKALKNANEYFSFLTHLEKNGVKVLPSVETLQTLGYKDIFEKLKNTDIGDKTCVYYDSFEEFIKGFPPVLRKEKVRILKSTYDDEYLVVFQDNQTVNCENLTTKQKHSFLALYDFLKFFEQKFCDDFKGGFSSCKYIKSDKILKVLLIKDRVVGIKNQGEYENPAQEKWREDVEFVLDSLDFIEPYCKNFALIWSMNFIYDNHKYILCDIECANVSIDPNLSNIVAKII